ncbi:MAG: hypothetical protein J2P54_05990 [Bradyrhizobiaceae bacterium]|nr:hypothetical protein [Bradyrhizobiaceae bacterium]
MMKILIIALVTLAATVDCRAGEGFFDQYFVRSDSVTLDAGNAQDVNAAIQVIDPWPRRSANRRIPANGARMTGAIQRYRNPTNQSGRPEGQSGQSTPFTGTGSSPAMGTPSNAQ